MARSFDVVVIGSGNAGQGAAGVARAAGRSVAVVDGVAPGGTCALRGCVPKKVLVAAAEALDVIARAGAHGIEVGPARLDWARLIAREQALIATTSDDVRGSLARRGIALVSGWARFVGPTALEVDGERIDAGEIVVATGSRARELGVPGGELCWTSDDVLSNPVLADPVVFVGSGVIAFEFAHVLVRAGARVTVLGRRALAGFDPVVVERLVGASRDAGIAVELGTTLRAVERAPDGAAHPLQVRWVGADGVEHVTQAAAVVNAAGRVPDYDRLDLAAAGVDVERGRPVLVDGVRSRSNPRVRFAGDALPGTPQLSPVASLEGAHVGAWLTGGAPAPLDYRPIPHAVFAIPTLAAVGLGEAEARAAGFAVTVRENDMVGWRSARTYAETHAFSRIVTDEATGRVLGATLLGHGAAEVVHAFAFAIARGLTGAELAGTVFAYPTFHADLKYQL